MKLKPSFFLSMMLLLSSPLGTGCVRHLAELDMSDSGIRARVISELKSHPELNLRYLEVNVHVRVVYLSGMIEDADKKREIVRIIRRIPGVRHIVNNLLLLD